MCGWSIGAISSALVEMQRARRLPFHTVLSPASLYVLGFEQLLVVGMLGHHS